MGKFRDLLVYKKGFILLMDIFEVSKCFPKNEMYSLTDQIRRSSRSVCSNVGEGYRKRQYPRHFISKLTDSAMENSETQVWLDVAFASKYISEETYNDLMKKSEEIDVLLNFMIRNPLKFS